MSGSQHKKQEKARRKALREKARREERQRNVMTGIIVGVVLLIGGVLIALSTGGDDDPEDLLSSIEPTASPTATPEPTEAPTAAVPADPDAEPGEPVDPGLEPAVDDRPVACGAEEPDNVAETRPQYPGGPSDVLEQGIDYAAVVETSCGQVTLDLFEEESPVTTNSFVFLAQEGFFNGLEVFRNATSIGALQTGGGDQTNTWQIGYRLPDELGFAQSEGYPVGAVAMANSGPNSGGSQFFFVYNDSFDTAFEGQETFAVFGLVTEGLDVLQEIGDIPVEGETPTERVYIEDVEIVEQ